jgi:CheY-like chemotaxis protein
VSARVLVVDDDAPTCELLREILSSAGFETTSHTDSAEAASRVQLHKFHAIFLDARMPPPDGIRLAQQLRGSQINATSVIVMITGDDDRSVMGRAFEAGVKFFLFKPIDRSRLLQLIRATSGTIERERRRFLRIRLRCRVTIDSPQASSEGTTLDLSLGGTLVQSRSTIRPGTSVTVNLELEPGSGPLALAARVVRIVGNDCMGMQFENLAPKESERLQLLLLPLILAAT